MLFLKRADGFIPMESGTAGCSLHPDMLEQALAAFESRVDLMPALGLGEMAEMHGDEMISSVKPLECRSIENLVDEIENGQEQVQQEDATQNPAANWQEQIGLCPPGFISGKDPRRFGGDGSIVQS